MGGIMRLKNKKTGEIHEITQAVSLSDDMDKKFAIYSKSEGHNYAYRTLAELNDEWEDYEEPKPWWYIDITLDVKQGELFLSNHVEQFKIVGNYFETKEQAEKAVEKLKAWKRLKDKGFRFGHFVTYGEDGYGKVVFKCDEIKLGYENAKEFYEDIVLLFGGEE